MKYIAMLLTLVSSIMLFYSQPAHALTIIDPNQPSAIASSDIVVSALPFGSETSFIELYNQTDHAVQLHGYSVELIYSYDDELTDIDETLTHIISLPEGYLLADSYLAMVNNDQTASGDLGYDLPNFAGLHSLKAINLIRSDQTKVLQIADMEPTADKYTWLVRKSGSSGDGSTQDNFTQKQTEDLILNGFGFYQRPESLPEVRIDEVLARSIDCAPHLSQQIGCYDYIKIYNASIVEVDLSDFVLRSDSGTSYSSNSFQLNVVMMPGSFWTVYQKDDGGSELSLDDSGGYVWLEDKAHIAVYESSVVQYPGASVDQIGWSWALSSDLWQWTNTPMPGQPNLITLPLVEEESPDEDYYPACEEGKYRNPETNRCKTIEVANNLVPCRVGQERNPATNRCRSIAVSSPLVPCGPGQERNPATNRCRSTSLASSSLVPCRPGQERNPDTNRCRSVASLSSSLVPCDPGEERNPLTNRCRKSTSAILAASTKAQDDLAADTGSQALSWYYLVGGVAAIAGAYGVWEWRGEIAGGARRLRGLISKP